MSADKAKKPTIHYLYSGKTPCNMRRIPNTWPENNTWSDDWKDVNCSICLSHKPEEK